MEHPRAPRYRFSARIDLTDVQSDRRVLGRTRDISLHGCAVATADDIPERSKVHVTITYGLAAFTGSGKVVYSTSDGSIGILFTHIDPGSEEMLDGWIAALSKGSRAR